MNKVLRKLTRAVDYAFMGILRLLPVQDNCIVLHSKPDFSDNAWAFYSFLKEKGLERKYTIVWMVDSPGRYSGEEQAIFIDGSVKGLRFKRDYYLSRAKFIIYTHRAPLQIWRRNQILIHTTHSASQLKAMAGAEHEKLIQPNYRLRCGHDGVERIKRTMGPPRDDFLVIGMPRLDLLFRHRDCMPALFGGKVYDHYIMAMETFKQGALWSDSDSGVSLGLNVIHSLDELRRLNDFLARRNAVLIIKPHRAQNLSFIERNPMSNIAFIMDEQLDEKHIQSYEVLENCDLLLTDYSSVYYDYLLLDRPIGFMLGDMENYTRGFIIDDPLSEMTGEKIRSVDELIRFIDESYRGVDRYREDRKALIRRVFDYPDDGNCRRLLEFMQSKGLKER